MAKFEYPYKKGVNITAWVLQILVCLILLAASAWLLTLVRASEYEDSFRKYSGLLTAAAGLQIAITTATIVLDIVEIVLIAKSRMPPALYLASACVKTTIWVVILVLNLVAVSIIAIVLTLVLAVTSLLQLIYGAILVHRKRRGTLFKGRYAPAHNPDGNGTNVEAGAAYAPHNNASYYYAGTTTEYKPTASTSPAPAYASPHSPHSPPQPQAQYGHHPASYELDSRPQAA